MKIGHSPDHTAICVIATLGLVASNLAAGSASRPEGPSFSLSAQPVTLATRCDRNYSIASVHLRAHNHGDVPSPATTILVRDTVHELSGSAELPQLAAHESRRIHVPLMVDSTFDPSNNPAAIAGDHTLGVYVADPLSPHTSPTHAIADISTTIPAAFCTQPMAPRSLKSSSATKAAGPPPSIATMRRLLGSPQAQSLFAPTSPLAASIVPSAPPASDAHATTALRAGIVPLVVSTPAARLSITDKRIPIALRIGVPQNVRAASNAGDCENHLHAFSQIGGVVSCQSMIASGNVVLIWDLPADAPADGFRVYALAGGERGPAVASVTGRARTLANLPPLGSGPIPQCYVVTSTDGANESLAGPAYCGKESTVSQTLSATYTRGVWEDHGTRGAISGSVPADPVSDGPVVGYYHVKDESTVGDTRYTKIHRYAVAFDLDALRDKRLVSARLHLTIQSSYGAGNNYSCATGVASGIEYWWKPDAQSWIEGSFDGSAAALNDTGPVVTADVTRLVAAVIAGSPNYGFVVRNNDENLGAFTDSQCETVYGNPQLDVVYYDR